MAKTLDYQITLYPAHRDGAFVVTQFQMMARYPEQRIQAAGMDDLIDKVTHFAMEHGESCSASVRCLAPRKPPGFKRATENLYFNLVDRRLETAAPRRPEAPRRKPPGRPDATVALPFPHFKRNNDMTQVIDFYAQMLDSQKRAADQRVETRAALLVELRALGITNIEVPYEGYGDSGNVEDVVVTPDAVTLTEELRRRVEAFGWDFAYALSPGFENNEGGYGELTWALEADKIDVSHSNRYIETNTTEHDGL